MATGIDATTTIALQSAAAAENSGIRQDVLELFNEETSQDVSMADLWMGVTHPAMEEPGIATAEQPLNAGFAAYDIDSYQQADSAGADRNAIKPGELPFEWGRLYVAIENLLGDNKVAAPMRGPARDIFLREITDVVYARFQAESAQGLNMSFYYSADTDDFTLKAASVVNRTLQHMLSGGTDRLTVKKPIDNPRRPQPNLGRRELRRLVDQLTVHVPEFLAGSTKADARSKVKGVLDQKMQVGADPMKILYHGRLTATGLSLFRSPKSPK